jgi:HD-GYP domain-containing protein (c-di-GMP phosphodiesterase class II)
VEVMSSRQLYRKPLSAEETIAELRRGSGAQWDARIVALVLDLIGSGELELAPGGMRLLELAER